MPIELLDLLHFDSVNMQYDDDAEIAPSTITPLQGVAVTYKSTLDSLMSFVHVTPLYTQDKTYTKGKLPALIPEHVLHWMNLKAFGVEDPPNGCKPYFGEGKFACVLEQSDIVFHVQSFNGVGFRSQ